MDSSTLNVLVLATIVELLLGAMIWLKQDLFHINILPLLFMMGMGLVATVVAIYVGRSIEDLNTKLLVESSLIALFIFIGFSPILFGAWRNTRLKARKK